MTEFCETYNLKNLIHEPTCYKNPISPTCIDLILTNKHRSFQHSKTIETGLSDFHKMTITILKTFFQKKSPTIIKYRNYKKFDEQSFRHELKNELEKIDMENIDYNIFHHTFINILEKYAPIKEKLIRANNAPFMNKNLSKSIMTRSKLRNRYNNNPTNENLAAYKKQRNLCVKLSRKAKKDHYSSLDTKCITDNKQFWNCVKPLFSDKQKVVQKIILIEDENIISNDKEVAEKMNEFFINAVSNLGIEDLFPKNKSKSYEGTGRIPKIIKRFESHPSILKIKEAHQINENFSFVTTPINQIESEIHRLSTDKATAYNDIPAKIICKNSDLISPFLTKIYDNSKNTCVFPDLLKLGDAWPT